MDIKVGDKVLFDRGMFGKWQGTVRSIYSSRRWNSYGKKVAKVSYVRANGTNGSHICLVENLTAIVNSLVTK